ncbi:MAG: glucoamylase family protein [Gammaproteobacteria bacterium]
MGIKTFIANIHQWLRSINKNKKSVDYVVTDPPLVAELFSDDQMEQHGSVLAQSHRLTQKRTAGVLLKRLSVSEATLVKTGRILTDATSARNHITPAGEWLLDNFYLIEEQIRIIKRHIPKGYEKNLPQLASGFLQGCYPRVYDIALQIIGHGHGRWDMKNLGRFVRAYQSVTKLTLAELWAIPIMLRLALIENLSHVCIKIASIRSGHHLADRWADQMIEAAASDSKRLVLVIADMVRSEPPMMGAFIAELTRRLQNAALALPLTWIEQRLAEAGLTIEQLVQAENTQQAVNQVTVSNSITSLRRLSEVDWCRFVEIMSEVEHTLQKDPTATYSNMDFTTRDRYRHVVQRLARASLRSETEVAETAIQLAKVASESATLSDSEYSDCARHSHVGFYLIDAGLSQLKQALGMRRSFWEKLRYWGGNDRSLLGYLGLITLIVGVLTGCLLFKASQSGVNTVELVVLGIVIALSISQLAVTLVNWGVMLLVKPHPLPKMDFTSGIPAKWRTLVVVPAMLGSVAEVESLTEALEVRFLGNRDNHLHFALLTDFNDAPQEHMPDDSALLALAQERVVALNKLYPRDEDIFFLLHRPRRWNAGEQVWMGYERKRGKLSDLNALLRGHAQTSFSLIVGRIAVLANVKYVITLDSDTLLPRDSARQFIGAMAHPLNRPCYDAVRQRVVAGYGILQPRVAEALSNSGPTRYGWLCSSDLGIDPYTRTVSDIYQDLFDEGSFIGKGIYDVDLFQRVFRERFPENLILSHDLLEGCYLRSGFLSDVLLYENFTGNYLTYVKRRIRWIRGDWQLVGWLLPRVLSSDGRRKANPLSALSKWKLFDNLRRSLVSVSLLVLLGLGWTVLPATYFWFGAILAIVLLPPFVMTLLELTRKPSDMRLNHHLSSIMQVVYRRFNQLVFYLACLPHEAWYSLSALMRACWRRMISHRHLLEWVPSNQVDYSFHGTPTEWIARMWIGPVAALAIVVLLVVSGRSESLLLAAPLLALWAASPLLARWVSQPFQRAEAKLDSTQIRFLHKMARKTWGFFETFITAEDHWLPPDNYQEAPVEALCHRTSPTNMGLALLANLSAYDFGYINSFQLLQRTANTIQTMIRLERYRGHFYNWYDTQTLEPLKPRYVSTVDGGNLAGHLLTLRQGLLALSHDPLLKVIYLDGLENTLDVLAETTPAPEPAVFSHFRQLLSDARLSFTTWPGALSCCARLCVAAEQIAELWSNADVAATLQHAWSQKLLLQCYALRDELMLFSEMSSTLAANATLHDIAMSVSTGTAAVPEHQIKASQQAAERIALIETLAAQVFALAQMDVGFLYNETSRLMTIGFNVDQQIRDRSHYDLLSSEARLASFVAIAQGQVPQESWFALGRLQAMSKPGQPILMSWNGSMFEYLMPLLVMPSYPGTLLDRVCQTVVNRHINYGKQQGVPWGISESGFNAVDAHSNYLYRAFGVPELGLKRGLAEDLVVAPYATVMALMVEPEAACLNLQRLATDGAVGRFGFYEAIDFTRTRLPRNSSSVLVRSFMVHHQAMNLLAFSYLFHDQPMQRRFASDPLFRATLLLLQERIPKPVASYFQMSQSSRAAEGSSFSKASTWVFNSPNTPVPQVQLLSNGRYHLMLTQAGSGYSRWKEWAVTRWREDSTCDNWGLFSYVRDVKTGVFWSTSYQPTAGSVENFKAIFSEMHVEFGRTDAEIDTHTEIVVSPEDDIELRRSRIHNRSKISRTIEFTSYAEVVLASQADDLAQPAFSNLFVETELLSQQQAILVTRRPRSEQQSSSWMCHKLNVYSEKSYTLSFETDRSRFVGRDGTPAMPYAMTVPGDLSNTAGTVLDPIVAIRCRVSLEPGALITLDLITGVTDTRDHCIALVEKYHDRHLANRIFELTSTYSQVLLHQLNISEADAQLYGKLAGAIIYASNTYRAEPRIIASNRYGQSKLWGYSISGDLPIVLLHIKDVANIELVQQLVQAQIYWRRKGLVVDLVILNEEHVSYRQMLQDQVMSLINTWAMTDQAGGIFVRVAEQMPLEDRTLLQSVARVVLSDKHGTLKEQLDRRHVNTLVMPLLTVSKPPRYSAIHKLAMPQNVHFFNGLGGFMPDGDEYIIRLDEGNTTPAPWVNVLANPNFGTLVSESGQAYTWTENAHEFRLTPWDNDPVQDSSGEAFYLRDDETGQFWSATALPCRGLGDYRTRHGFGYSVFEHIEDGIYSEMWMYVALDAPVKFIVLKVRNDSMRRRRLSAFGYVEWVLGDLRSKNAMHVITEISPSGALLAQNHYNTEFDERTAFFDAATSSLGLNARTVTGSRAEFIGRNRTRQQPAALECIRLSGRVGAGLDPCGAIQLAFDLAEGQTREIVFTLGAGQNSSDAETLAQRYHGSPAAAAALLNIRQYWRNILSKVRVTTQDPAVDLLANGWLLYQTLSSRLWGRSGYYQSSGAFGFRDQLQDVMALVHAQPELFRAQLLLCASRQFVEGDVQHWWHPPKGRGVRTRCSDDYLWLPFAICHYVETTGDIAVLDEQISFLQGRPLNASEESYYDLPIISSECSSLYQHCVRAICHGLQLGEHGLPLMGSGDWNDGMNLVGAQGRGESVWLGFFLYTVLKHFALLARRYNDAAFAERCDTESIQLQRHLELNGWDGEWYRRAYFDNGMPLGSASNTECRIDSIAQSWSVLSGAAEPTRAKQAMASLNHNLVRPSDGLVVLLDPPFNHLIPNPGYIQGYVPGIRENGGQYTHAAIWAVMAFVELGEHQLAWQLFNIINPINHGGTQAAINIYKIEPYVIAGDVYSVAPHIGRGGWSWYTGSAAWMYRLIIESLLGLQLEEGRQLRLTPHLPANWDGFTVDYRYGETVYQIVISRSSVGESITLDGVELDRNIIPLLDDRQLHHVRLTVSPIN